MPYREENFQIQLGGWERKEITYYLLVRTLRSPHMGEGKDPGVI